MGRHSIILSHRIYGKAEQHRQQSEGVTTYIWQTVGDNRVRPEHAARDGEEIECEDSPSGGHPGEAFGCRCSAIPVQLPDDPPIEPVYPELIIFSALRVIGTVYRLVKELVRRRNQLRQQRESNRETARKIANGHARDKHVVKKGDFPDIKTREDFQKHIEDIMNNPDEVKNLQNGKKAYWDNRSKTVVIDDPLNPDSGTAFKPSAGKRYFDNSLN